MILSRHNRLFTQAVCVVIAVGGGVLPVVAQVPPDVGILGALMLWISLAPVVFYLRRAEYDTVPLLPSAGAYYALFFALPVFLAPLAFHSADGVMLYLHVPVRQLTVPALALVVAGLICHFGAFYLGRYRLFIRLPRFRLRRQPSPSHLNTLYAALSIGGLVCRLVPEVQAAPSIGQFLDPAGLLGLGGLLLQWRNGALTRWQKIVVLLVLAPLAAYVRIRVFFLTDVILTGLFLALILLRYGRIRTVALLGAIGLLVMVSYNATISARANGTTFIDKTLAILDNAAQILSADPLDQRIYPKRVDGVDTKQSVTISGDRRVSSLVHRLGQIWVFQLVYDRTPDPIPYMNGETYRPLLTSFIPRMLYPGKPEERAGGTFGLRYGFLDPGDGTSVNIPWVVELLTNFGPSAVVIGMAIFGLFLAFMDWTFNRPDSTEPEFLIGLTLIYRLGYEESNFSVMTGSLLPLFVGLVLYFLMGDRILERIQHASLRVRL